MSGMHGYNRITKSLGYSATIIVVALLVAGGCGGGSSSRGGGLPNYGAVGDYGSYQDGTDKWHVSFDVNALASALTTANFPTDNMGEVKRLVIQYLNQFYSGVSISFCTLPLENGSCPGPGEQFIVDQLGPNPYNVIAVWNAGDSAATGRAYQDLSNTNERVENDSSVAVSLGGAKLGVFIDRYSQIFAINHTLTLDDFAYYLAGVAAHEIGHSLGLEHDESSVHIMNPSSTIGQDTLSFRSADVSFLQSIMPGPGRN